MNRQGFALESSLFLMLLVAVLVAVSVSGVIPVIRTSSVDYRNARVTYAAEAGADAIMAQLHTALQDGALDDAELAAVVPPSIAGFTYDAITVSRQGGTEVETVTDGPFAGLYSLTQKLDITSRVRDQHANRSEVVVSAKAQAIPIFQFGIFYEKDLEIVNHPPMTFAGWVHTNGNLYLSSDDGFYTSLLTTPNKVFHNRKNTDLVPGGIWIDDAFGVPNNLNFDSRTHPVPGDFQFQSNALFDNRLKTDAYGVDSLRVPLPTGMPARAVMEPRLVSDVEVVRTAKFAWKADWYVEIDMGDANPCSGFGTLVVRDSGQVLPTSAECNAIFTMVPDDFYDSRQGHFVDAYNIDMAQLFAWIGGDSSKETRVLYITFTNLASAPDPQSDGVYPIVRVTSGAVLSNPISIATDRPLYVQGDYNTATWQPAALVGDAITLLSNSWTDAAHQAFAVTTASNTTVNTAVLAGHTPTPWDWYDGGGNAPHGGGVENFLRFVENWNNRDCHYAGSLVSLSFSMYATAPWSGSYYDAPDRDWQFDTRFEDPTNLPPGTPVVGSVIHTAFRPIY